MVILKHVDDVGVYAGFFAVVFFLFVAAPRIIAIFSAVIFGMWYINAATP